MAHHETTTESTAPAPAKPPTPVAGKSAWIMLAALASGYGWYLWLIVGRVIAGDRFAQIDLRGPILSATIVIVAIAALGHMLIAIHSLPDRPTAPTRAQLGAAGPLRGHVIAAAAAASLGLVVLGAHTFWITNTILLGLVAGELCGTVGRIAGRRAR